MSVIKVQSPTVAINCQAECPGSKSISNRLLIMNAFSRNSLHLSGLSDSDDTRLLMQVLDQGGTDIDAGEAGTSYRFLCAYLAGLPGIWTLRGSARMHERPIGALVDALREAGAEMDYLERIGFPPIRIHGKKLKGGKISLDPSVSSQFASALLMAAPYMERGLELSFTKEISSRPYLEMTVSMMQELGITIEWKGNKLSVLPGQYRDGSYEIEKDWSAVAFWLEICALSTSGSISIQGLSKDSIQGDRVAINIFSKLGVSSTFKGKQLLISKNREVQTASKLELDCMDFPDMVPALVCTCAGLGMEAFFSGLQTLQYKESNRIHALVTELKKTGAHSHYDEEKHTLHLFPGVLQKFDGILNSYNDHRLAMAFAPLSIKCGPIKINSAEVVSKSYPHFWDELNKAGFQLDSLAKT